MLIEITGKSNLEKFKLFNNKYLKNNTLVNE